MLIAFDFDGVLADSRRVVGAFLARLAEERGLPPPDWARLRDATLRQNLRAWGVRPWSLPGLVRRARRAVVADWAHLEPLPAGIEAVAWAAARALPVAIVSSNAQQAIRRFVAHHLGTVRFVAVVGDAPIFAKHRALGRVLSRAGCPPGGGIYVGDEVRDISSAQRAGARAVGVGWGKERPELLLAAGALAVAENGAALRAILGQLAARAGPP